MASLLRQIVAGPRARHAEADLDLCYVTDNIIATSGPSQTYPQRAYRNPLDRVVSFLDKEHGENWAIWEFRAEGTGYPDHLVYDRVRHYPWPDHHPPPFRLIPLMMGSMRNWLHGGELHASTAEHVKREDAGTDGQGVVDGVTKKGGKRADRVVVVHCKAGKGRSGTASCSYLISEEGWSPQDALARFTSRRMRPNFGAGVSIPSQLRTISYVDRWTRHGKRYVDKPVEILEVHIWGLRNGVKVDIAGYGDEGKKIEVLHTFKKEEREIVEGKAEELEDGGLGSVVWELAGGKVDPRREAPKEAPLADSANLEDDGVGEENGKGDGDGVKRGKSLKDRGSKLIHKASAGSLRQRHTDGGAAIGSNTSSPPSTQQEPGGKAVILRPRKPIRVANSDVQLAVERRNKSGKMMGFTMVTAVAHVWFNVFFEGNGPENSEQGKEGETEGVFGIKWEAMDGIKGSSRKGARALDRVSVKWRIANDENDVVPAASAPGIDTTTATKDHEVKEPAEGSPVPETSAADWHGRGNVGEEKDLGLRVQSPESADISKASSFVETEQQGQSSGGEAGVERKETWEEGIRTSGPTGEELGEGKGKGVSQ